MFGSGFTFGTATVGFGQPTVQVQPFNGTTIKFTPAQSTDTAQKGALSKTVTTKHMVITAMKEYEGKSLEELRLEDCLAYRRGPAADTTTSLGSLFGSTAVRRRFGLVRRRRQAAKPLFGSPAQPSQHTQQPSLFGAAQPAASAATGFRFGGAPASSTGGGLFGTGAPAVSAAPTAPFSFTFGIPRPAAQSQTAGLFGAKPAKTAAPFGTTSTSTFGGAFGSLAQPAAATAAAPTSLFGTTSTAPAGGIFAPKPAAAAPFGFSTGAPTSFGQAAPTQTSLIPAVSVAPAAGGLFGPPVPGTGAPTAAAAPFSFGGTPAAPFGAAATQPTARALPLFGQTAAQTAPTAFGSATTDGGMFTFPTAAASTAPTASAFGQPFAAAVLPANGENAATFSFGGGTPTDPFGAAETKPAADALPLLGQASTPAAPTANFFITIGRNSAVPLTKGDLSDKERFVQEFSDVMQVPINTLIKNNCEMKILLQSVMKEIANLKSELTELKKENKKSNDTSHMFVSSEVIPFKKSGPPKRKRSKSF